MVAFTCNGSATAVPASSVLAEMESPWALPLSITVVWLVRSYFSWTIKACDWERNREGKKKRKKRAGSFVIKVSWIQLNLDSRVASTKNTQNTGPLQSSRSLASSIHKHTDLTWHHCLTSLLQYQFICFFKSSKFQIKRLKTHWNTCTRIQKKRNTRVFHDLDFSSLTQKEKKMEEESSFFFFPLPIPFPILQAFIV